VSFPAEVKALIAVALPLGVPGAGGMPVTVLVRTSKVMFETCEMFISMPCPLPVKVLF